MRLAGIFALLGLLISSSALAQQAREQVELSRSIIQTERQIIVASNMGLTEQEAEDFWPVFKDFQEALRRVSDRRADLILELAKEFNSLSGEKAQEMLKDYLNIQAERTKVKQKFVGSFNKVLPPKKVVRYFQIESKLDSVIDYELAARIPLVRPDVAAPPQ